jgi:hypothetical protein
MLLMLLILHEQLAWRERHDDKTGALDECQRAWFAGSGTQAFPCPHDGRASHPGQLNQGVRCVTKCATLRRASLRIRVCPTTARPGGQATHPQHALILLASTGDAPRNFRYPG